MVQGLNINLTSDTSQARCMVRTLANKCGLIPEDMQLVFVALGINRK